MNEKEINDGIEYLNSFPLSENAQKLVNYLECNIDDIAEAYAD